MMSGAEKCGEADMPCRVEAGSRADSAAGSSQGRLPGLPPANAGVVGGFLDREPAVVTVSAILSVAAVRSFALQGSLRAWKGHSLRHREPQDNRRKAGGTR